MYMHMYMYMCRCMCIYMCMYMYMYMHTHMYMYRYIAILSQATITSQQPPLLSCAVFPAWRRRRAYDVTWSSAASRYKKGFVFGIDLFVSGASTEVYKLICLG